MKIKKFEDLESWKKARKLTNRVYGNCLPVVSLETLA
jgi:hypothetical protein